MAIIDVEIRNIFKGHADAIYTLIKEADKKSFFSGSADGFVGYWNLQNGTFEKPVAKVKSSIYSLLLKNSSTLLIGEQSGVFNVIDFASKSLVKSLQVAEQGIFALAFLSQFNLVILGAGDGNIYVLNHRYDVIQTLNLCNKNIRSIDVSPCGKFLIVGASDHQIYFLEYRDKLELKQVIPAHQNSVFTAVYKEGFTLLSGGRDAMLNQWTWNPNVFLDSQKWELNQSIPAHNYTINKISINSNKNLFATCSRDKTIKIWNYNTNQLVKVIDINKFPDSHTHSVNTILWLNEYILLSAGDDKKIIAWHIQEK